MTREKSDKSIPPAVAWRRLGDLLLARRAALGHVSRAAFVRSTGGQVTGRLVYDIETCQRTNYTQATLTTIEAMYQWQHGSIARVLGGGDPVELLPHQPNQSLPRQDVVITGEGADLLVLAFPPGTVSRLSETELAELIARQHAGVLRAIREMRREGHAAPEGALNGDG